MACTSLSTSLETDSLYFLSLGTLAFEIQPPQFEEAPETYGKPHTLNFRVICYIGIDNWNVPLYR